MTPRQHYAALAMHALLAQHPDTLAAEARREGADTVGEYVRNQAFAMADLMLSEPAPAGAQPKE